MGRERVLGSRRDRRASDDELDDEPVQHLTPGKLSRVDRWADGDDAATTEAGLAAALGAVEEARASFALPVELARTLQAELRADLTGVRIHNDNRAHQAAAQLKSRAFTIGTDIYFAAGEYDPTSAAGIELIAHEATHVAQQARGTAPAGVGVSRPGDPHEVEAEHFAHTFRQRVEDQLGSTFDHVAALSGAPAKLASEAFGASAFILRNVVMLADASPERDALVHQLAEIERSARAPRSVRQALGTLRTLGDEYRPQSAAPMPAPPSTGGGSALGVHRSGSTTTTTTTSSTGQADEAGNADKRIQYFVANAPIQTFPIAGAEGEQVYAFWDPVSEHRYTQSSPAPWKREDYLSVLKGSSLPAVGDSSATNDLKKLTDAAAQYKIARVTPKTWAFIKDGKWVADVEDIRPESRAVADPSEQFAVYWKVIKALPGRVGSFTWQGGKETYVDAVRTFSPAEAESYRHALRDALVAGYHPQQDGGWQLFYDEVMKPRLIPAKFNGLTGSVFEKLLQESTGTTLDNKRPTFISPKLKTKRIADNANGAVLIDAKASLSGIVKDQAEDYAKIVTQKIPGLIKGTDENDVEKIYEGVLYTVPGQQVADLVQKQLELWVDDETRARFHVSPTPKDVLEFLASFNPTLSFTSTEKGKTSYVFHNPPSQISGMGIKQVTITTSADASKVTGGSIDFGLNMAGAFTQDSIKKPITPSPDKPGLAASVENKFAGLKSSLDKVLGAVDVDAKLIDGGIEASVALKPGASKIPGFDINAAKLTARYLGGALQVDGEVEITHKSKKITGSIKVGWDGKAWTFDGKATLAEGLVPGLSAVELGVSYTGGKTTISCPHAAYHRKVGAIDLTGTVRNLKYDVDKGAFSGSAELDADLGAFGKASAIAELENNELKAATFAYDSPEFKYPAKSDKPGFKGTVGGTIKYAAGKFSGDIRGTANINLPGLKAVAGDSGVGLAVDAHVNADGTYSGTVKSTSPLKFGKHIQIPSVSCTLDQDGALSGSFEVEVVNIKYLETARIKCNVSKNGIEIAEAHVAVPFGSEAKNKFWGKLSVDYTQGQGLQIGGEINYKIKEGMVATGTLKYATETHEISLEMTVSEIKLFDKTVSKTLFKGGKQISIVNVYGVGIYIDIGFELGFNFGFKLGLKPTLTFDGLSLDTWEFKQIAAKMELLGSIYAELVGTPKLGIGVFVLDPSLLRGGGGLKMPIVGRADLKPTGTFNVAYSPGGDVSGDAKIGASMMFGIAADVTPYAEFSVLNDLWNPKWEGSPLTHFDILKPKELFKFELDFGGDMSKKDTPPLPAENAAPDAAQGGSANKGMEQSNSAPQTHDNGAANKNQAAESTPKEGGDEGPFSIAAMIDKLKGMKGFATAEKAFQIAKKVWEVVKGVYDLVQPLFDLIKGRVEEFINLFDAELPKSASDVMPWVWKLAKAVFGLSFGGLLDLVSAINTMTHRAGAFAIKLINHAVQSGQIGVRRHHYYIWRPWPLDDYEFMAASEFKVNIPGVIDLGHQGPPSVLLTPGAAIAIGLYEALDTMGVPHTSGAPNNDIWAGS